MRGAGGPGGRGARELRAAGGGAAGGAAEAPGTVGGVGRVGGSGVVWGGVGLVVWVGWVLGYYESQKLIGGFPLTYHLVGDLDNGRIIGPVGGYFFWVSKLGVMKSFGQPPTGLALVNWKQRLSSAGFWCFNFDPCPNMDVGFSFGFLPRPKGHTKDRALLETCHGLEEAQGLAFFFGGGEGGLGGGEWGHFTWGGCLLVFHVF